MSLTRVLVNDKRRSPDEGPFGFDDTGESLQRVTSDCITETRSGDVGREGGHDLVQ